MSEEQQQFDLMGWLEKGEGGRGGYVCQFVVQGGYKVFAAGHNDDDSFFPVENNDAQAAERKAKAFSTEVGDTRGPRQAVLLTMFADTVLNKAEKPKWEGMGGRRTFSIPTFTDAFKEVLLPSLKEARENGLEFGQKQWGRISYAPDPFRPERDDGQPNLVPFIAQTFSSEEDALAVAQEGGSGNGGRTYDIPEQPEAWSDDIGITWPQYFKQMVEAFEDNSDTTPASLVYPDGGVTLQLVLAAKKQAGGAQIPF